MCSNLDYRRAIHKEDFDTSIRAIHMPNCFCIRHPLITLKISIEEVSRLHIHEEIIPEVVDKLAAKIEADQMFTNPIMVDEKSLVVLDGMHRVAAVQKIGYRFMPVCLIDYGNSNVVLSSWHRLLSENPSFNDVPAVVEKLALTAEQTTWDTAYSCVENRVAETAIFLRERCFAIHGAHSSVKETYDLIKIIESQFRSKGCSITYDTADGAKQQVYSGKAAAGLMTPTLSKDEVLQVALSGKVFPQKATRHIVPARPMSVNAPNEWLTGRISLEEANNRLVELLSSKTIQRLAGGQVLDRRYEEELYIFQ